VSLDREPVRSIERDNPHVVREVRHYIRFISDRLDAGRGIWFTGQTGTGKTTLAMLISKAAMEADRTVAIFSLPRLLAMLRETYGETARYSLSELIDRLCAVDLLHVDDLGAQQTSPWVLEQLYTIVNTRYEDGRALLLTTNLVGNEDHADEPGERPPDGAADPSAGHSEPDHHPESARLRRQIGRRTVSRIYEICGDPLPLFGGDHRIELPLPRSEGSGLDEPAEPPAEPRDWDPFDDSTWDDEAPRYGRPRGARSQRLD
jgi:DNA replication protein DnaC